MLKHWRDDPTLLSTDESCQYRKTGGAVEGVASGISELLTNMS